MNGQSFCCLIGVDTDIADVIDGARSCIFTPETTGTIITSAMSVSTPIRQQKL
jgi:hypothetical protein